MFLVPLAVLFILDISWSRGKLQKNNTKKSWLLRLVFQVLNDIFHKPIRMQLKVTSWAVKQHQRPIVLQSFQAEPIVDVSLRFLHLQRLSMLNIPKVRWLIRNDWFVVVVLYKHKFLETRKIFDKVRIDVVLVVDES